MALAASGCDNGSSTNDAGVNVLVTPSETSNDSNSDTTVVNPNSNTTVVAPNTDTTEINLSESTNVQQYEDTFVRLNYPEGWILNTMSEEVNAQFLEPGLNAEGGQSNCGLISDLAPGASLVELTAEFLELYDDFPEPQTSLVIVNGTDIARIDGTITVIGVTIDSSSQLAYENQIAHAVLCVDVDPENAELIFNSMVIK